jgi:hypothetical protein
MWQKSKGVVQGSMRKRVLVDEKRHTRALLMTPRPPPRGLLSVASGEAATRGGGVRGQAVMGKEPNELPAGARPLGSRSRNLLCIFLAFSLEWALERLAMRT